MATKGFMLNKGTGSDRFAPSLPRRPFLKLGGHGASFVHPACMKKKNRKRDANASMAPSLQRVPRRSRHVTHQSIPVPLCKGAEVCSRRAACFDKLSTIGSRTVRPEPVEGRRHCSPFRPVVKGRLRSEGEYTFAPQQDRDKMYLFLGFHILTGRGP